MPARQAAPARKTTPAATRRAALRQALRQTFGHDALRAGQRLVVQRVLDGDSTLAIMPTGAGKSLCYQLPALLLAGRTLVVSPLIALMKDQCDRLRSLGVAAVQLNSSLSADDAHAAEAAVQDGSARIVFVTPERLADPAFMQLLQPQATALLVVDEAHCISSWGHDFRPAFLEIAQARRALGNPAVLALTATAPPDVARDICDQLHIPAGGVVNTGSYRPNLHYSVQLVTRDDDKLAQALAFVAQRPGSGIVYAATVKAATLVHEALLAAGEAAGLYHGRLPAAQRRSVQDAFMQGQVRVMVATNAFGLGIDKPDTRFVLHYQMPSGLDAYYQESGRAGRDGHDADCSLLYLHGDKAVQQFFLANKYPMPEDLRLVYATLRKAPPAPAGAWDASSLQAATGAARTKLAVALHLLRQQRVLTSTRNGALRLLRDNLSDDRLQALAAGYQERRDEDRALLEKMVAYAQTGYCRWKLLLEHLAARPDGFTRCAHCDNCRRIAALEQAEQPEPSTPAGRTAHAGERVVGEAVVPAVVPTVVPQPPSFAQGDSVLVKRYGRGQVLAADTLSVTVAFDNGEQRCFMPGYVTPWRPRQAEARSRGRPAQRKQDLAGAGV